MHLTVFRQITSCIENELRGVPGEIINYGHERLRPLEHWLTNAYCGLPVSGVALGDKAPPMYAKVSFGPKVFAYYNLPDKYHA